MTTENEVTTQSAPGWTWFILVIIIVLLGIGGCISSCHKKAKAKEVARQQAIAYALTHPPLPPEFPTSGEGHATKQVGLKVWLDPMKTYVRASKPARYVFVEDPDLFFDNTENARVQNTEHYKKWLDMPPGKYLVYPIKEDRLYFRWWQ